MPVILLAHRDPQLRASLGSALTARGFEVLGVDSVDAALDAAAAGATALLVEIALLADEDLEVKTRLDLRAGRPVRILALTHKASAEEMSMLKRHGAGLLSRPVEDIDRMVKMLSIIEEAPAPWEGSSAPTPAPPAQPSQPRARRGTLAPAAAPTPPPVAPIASPSRATIAPAPAPTAAPVAPPPRATIAPAPAPTIAAKTAEPASSAPWDAAPPTIPPSVVPSPAAAAPVAPPASPSSTFKPPPANFMPPDLSKSFPAASPKPAPPPSETTAQVPLQPPTQTPVVAAPPPPAENAPPPPPAPLPPPSSVETTPEPPTRKNFELASPEADAPAPPRAPAPLPMVPVAPAPAPAAAAPSASLWGDETENDLERPAPTMDTNVFLDEPEEKTNKVGIPGGTDPLPAEDLSASTSVSAPKGPPKVIVEAEEGSTGAFAIPSRGADALSAPKPADAPPPPAPNGGSNGANLEERTQVIPELAASAIHAPPSADPFAMDTSTRPDIENISATVSPAWFSEGEDTNKGGGGGPIVLVVDDEPAFRTFLKDALGTQGYQVHTAINGPNALRFVKTQAPIDLVIADLHMPHMDGFELKHEIDKILGKAMPFIVCTADANEEKIQTAAQVGAAALVPKPIENLDAFFAIVTDTLKDAGVLSRSATPTS